MARSQRLWTKLSEKFKCFDTLTRRQALHWNWREDCRPSKAGLTLDQMADVPQKGIAGDPQAAPEYAGLSLLRLPTNTSWPGHHRKAAVRTDASAADYFARWGFI